MILTYPPQMSLKILMEGTEGLNCRLYRSASKVYVDVTHSEICNIKYLL
jgi:hypothetical protein